MKFYKYRIGSSSSAGKWQYVQLSEGENVEDFFEEMSKDHDWSEHFRGIEYNEVKSPPIEWLNEQIENFQANISINKKMITEYSKLKNIMQCK